MVHRNFLFWFLSITNYLCNVGGNGWREGTQNLILTLWKQETLEKKSKSKSKDDNINMKYKDYEMMWE